MPGKAYLTNIAAGLCGSFASRNNDLDGYWAIGKLRSLAEQLGRTTVTLDVLASSMEPSSSGFAPVLARYHHLLAKLAGLSRIPLKEITSARINVDFAPSPWPSFLYYQPQWGDQFIVDVTITAHGRTTGMARHAGYCRMHDPAYEHRSSRAADG